MTTANHNNLRVHCLCGQKMQVAPRMYGHPAKCVACHQKWFIPDRSEIPEGTTILYLKDYPELSCQPRKFIASGEQAVPAAVLNDTSIIPLDSLESLRLLHGYRYDLQRRRESTETRVDAAVYRPLFASYERSLQRVWDRLSLRLEREQQATATQLAAIEDEIADLNIAFRGGDCALDTFLERTTTLRHIREGLVRHSHNLTAWRAMGNTSMAGDVAEVALESFDEESFDFRIPPPVPANVNKPLLVTYGDELSTMLGMRAALARRKDAWMRMGAENNCSVAIMDEGLAQTEAAIARNMAHIIFCRVRMEQLLLDNDSDMNALVAYKEVVLERTENGLRRDDMCNQVSNHIQRIEEDVVQLQSLLQQIAIVSAPIQAPTATNTFVQLLGGVIRQNILAGDTALLFMAAALLVTGLLLFADEGASGTAWLAVISCGTAIATAVAAVVLGKNLRSLVLAILWLLLLALLALFLYHRAVTDEYLIVLREGDNFWPPVISIRGWLLVTGAACAGAGTGLACSKHRRSKGSLTLTSLSLVLLCALFGSAIVAIMHTIAPRPTVLTLDLYDAASAPMNEIERPITADETTAGVLQAETPERETDLGQTTDEVRPGDDLMPEDDRAESSDMPTVEDEGADMAASMIVFALRGVVSGQDAEPRFRTTLSFPDGRTETLTLRLGEAIYGEWYAREYNRDTKKLTISNGERLLVLQAGLRVPLQPNNSSLP